MSDVALKRACYVLRFLLADRESVRQAFYAAQSRVVVLAHDEKIRDLPEYEWLPRVFDSSVRALGGTPLIPVTAIAEENLLCFRNGSSPFEDILVRELAISILLNAIPMTQLKLERQVRVCFRRARENDLWKETSAGESQELYFVGSNHSFLIPKQMHDKSTMFSYTAG